MKKILLLLVGILTIFCTYGSSFANSKDYTQALDIFYQKVESKYSKVEDRISIYKNVKEKLGNIPFKYRENSEKYAKVVKIVGIFTDAINKKIDSYNTTVVIKNKQIGISFVIPESMESNFANMHAMTYNDTTKKAIEEDSVINYGDFFSAVNNNKLPPVGGVGPIRFFEAKVLAPGYKNEHVENKSFDEYCSHETKGESYTPISCALHTTKNGFRYIKKAFRFESVGLKEDVLMYFVENSGSDFSVLAFSGTYKKDERKFETIIESIEKLPSLDFDELLKKGPTNCGKNKVVAKSNTTDGAIINVYSGNKKVDTLSCGYAGCSFTCREGSSYFHFFTGGALLDEKREKKINGEKIETRRCSISHSADTNAIKASSYYVNDKLIKEAKGQVAIPECELLNKEF